MACTAPLLHLLNCETEQQLNCCDELTTSFCRPCCQHLPISIFLAVGTPGSLLLKVSGYLHEPFWHDVLDTASATTFKPWGVAHGPPAYNVLLFCTQTLLEHWSPQEIISILSLPHFNFLILTEFPFIASTCTWCSILNNALSDHHCPGSDKT